MSTESLFHRIVLVGDSAVGKTSIVCQYVYGCCTLDQQSTIGIDYFSKVCTVDDRDVRFQIWDTAGQERFHALIPSYLRNATVAFLVFDITLRSSFENLQKWYQTVTNVANPGLIVIGNKLDLEEDRQVTSEEGLKYAGQIGAEYIETSAIMATNLKELFVKAAVMPLPDQEKRTEEENYSPLVFTVDVGHGETRDEQGSTCSC